MRGVTRREFLQYGAGATGSALLGALGSRGASVGAGGSQSVTVLQSFGSGNSGALSTYETKWNNIFGKFKNQTGIQVTFDNTPYSVYTQKVQTEFEAGSPADVIWADPGSLPEYVSRGWVVPLDGHIASSSVIKKKDFLGSVWESGSYKGKQYGIPIDWDVRVWFYNQAVFERLGISSVPKTIDEVKSAALEVTSKDSSTFGYSWPMQNAADWMDEGLSPIMLANGGSVLSSDAKKVTFDSAANKDTFQFFSDLWKAGAVPQQSLSMVNQAQYPIFMSGKIAMLATGIFVVAGQFEPANFNAWGTFAPTGRSGKLGTPLSASIYVIPSKSKHQDAAWKTIELIMKPQNILAFTTDPTAHLETAPENKSRFGSDPRYKALFELAADGGKQEITPNPQITSQTNTIWQYSQEILLGKMTVDQGLSAAATAIQQTLST